VQIDWPRSFRLLLWDGKGWNVHRQEQDLPPPENDLPRWFDLGGIESSEAIIELRRSSIDDWWTSWNLALGAPMLEGEAEAVSFPQRESRLSLRGMDLSRVPKGVTVRELPGEIRYKTPTFEVGFALGRAGFSHLALDQTSQGRTERNLLRLSPFVVLQGLQYAAVGDAPLVAPMLRHMVSGSVQVEGGRVSYTIRLGEGEQEFAIAWEVSAGGIGFRMRRTSLRDVRVWQSSAWTIACDSEITPTTVLGKILRSGQTGSMEFPILFHAPGHGTFRISCSGNEAPLRADSHRPHTFTSLEFHLGERAQPEGDALLPRGTYQCEGFLEPYRFAPPLRRSTPRPVATAVERCGLTALSYRADTATLSNNGNSMHAPLCMDSWSAVATRLGELLPGIAAVDLLRDSLERWLDGGPGYASGGFVGEEGLHRAEDEYIMTGTAVLLGLADYLASTRSSSWLSTYAQQIERQLTLMRARDLDGDGIVESPYRDGVSGSHRWSTNWYDVISYGWKDALSNALLYRALVLFGKTLPELGKPELAAGLADWAGQLKESFSGAFLNGATGWRGGWRSRDGVLHDYAFLPVNGAAVLSGVLEEERARSVMKALWKEAARIGLPDARLGLPGNLWPVADHDMAELMHGKPMGHYLNGGLTHSQSMRFVGALYRVGMTSEADDLLESLCESLADGSAFSGCNSGVDWRYWDGGACGYEGLLTDQFGILAVALERYGRPRSTTRS